MGTRDKLFLTAAGLFEEIATVRGGVRGGSVVTVNKTISLRAIHSRSNRERIPFELIARPLAIGSQGEAEWTRDIFRSVDRVQRGRCLRGNGKRFNRSRTVLSTIRKITIPAVPYALVAAIVCWERKGLLTFTVERIHTEGAKKKTFHNGRRINSSGTLNVIER